MEHEIGIVCGRCDAYSNMGTARCASCGNDLALSPFARAAAAPPVIEAPAPPPPAAPLRRSQTEPPASYLGADLRPRKHPSGTMTSPVSAIRAQGGDSAVSSSGGFDNRASAKMRAGQKLPQSEPRIPVAAPNL